MKENKKDNQQKGTIHPLSLLAEEAYQAFADMGFEIATGPEMESEWYNFDVLNIPANHPARDMQDTFWIKDPKSGEKTPKDRKVLRTHTTGVTAWATEQAAKNGRIPSAFVSVGKVFRNEATDATHEMQFFQIDGSVLGKVEDGFSLAHMKGILTNFYKKMLGDDIEIEFRPSFFPFTEPSIEVFAKFKGRWLEMMGGGMTNPAVIRNIGLDPEKVQGFCFGGGLDRIAMIKWGVPDVRLFYQGDLRLNQL
jgi:phenylalanyl-tRNA synthetase alpha chain